MLPFRNSLKPSLDQTVVTAAYPGRTGWLCVAAHCRPMPTQLSSTLQCHEGDCQGCLPRSTHTLHTCTFRAPSLRHSTVSSSAFGRFESPNRYTHTAMHHSMHHHTACPRAKPAPQGEREPPQRTTTAQWTASSAAQCRRTTPSTRRPQRKCAC